MAALRAASAEVRAGKSIPGGKVNQARPPLARTTRIWQCRGIAVSWVIFARVLPGRRIDEDSTTDGDGSAAVTMGRGGRRRGADDLARGLFERPRGHGGQPLWRRERDRSPTRSSPNCNQEAVCSVDHRRNCCRATPTASATSWSAAGRPRLGNDLWTWTRPWTASPPRPAGFGELTGDEKATATRHAHPPIDTATWKGQAYGIPRTRNVQLLIAFAGADPAEDVRRDDHDGRGPWPQGTLDDRHDRSGVRGLRRDIGAWCPRMAAPWSTGQDGADRRRQDRPALT